MELITTTPGITFLFLIPLHLLQPITLAKKEQRGRISKWLATEKEDECGGSRFVDKAEFGIHGRAKRLGFVIRDEVADWARELVEKRDWVVVTWGQEVRGGCGWVSRFIKAADEDAIETGG
ncbi:hypothetical protein L484_013213 [Morus notabilis]|uniref:Uncharacterized protein n=1 Tax=Morus notabilis TaxID=981085 RepID=W9RMF5_9ROSA|nr:hypothetical protein L484_013213 [Morus notabilis]